MAMAVIIGLRPGRINPPLENIRFFTALILTATITIGSFLTG